MKRPHIELSQLPWRNIAFEQIAEHRCGFAQQRCQILGLSLST